MVALLWQNQFCSISPGAYFIKLCGLIMTVNLYIKGKHSVSYSTRDGALIFCQKSNLKSVSTKFPKQEEQLK